MWHSRPSMGIKTPNIPIDVTNDGNYKPWMWHLKPSMGIKTPIDLTNDVNYNPWMWHSRPSMGIKTPIIPIDILMMGITTHKCDIYNPAWESKHQVFPLT